MKISVNDEELFTISDIQKQVIQNDIAEEIFDEDMKRRIKYIIMHKYERCFERLAQEWDPILKERYKTLPTNKDEYAMLVFLQPEYQIRKEMKNLCTQLYSCC